MGRACHSISACYARALTCDMSHGSGLRTGYRKGVRTLLGRNIFFVCPLTRAGGREALRRIRAWKRSIPWILPYTAYAH